jgi:hypothetical protein
MAIASVNKPMAGAGKTRLLVIDDGQKLCRLIRDYLEPMGYEVESAHTAPDGLEKALTGQHEAIILDVMLPGMDGFELVKQCDREDVRRGLPGNRHRAKPPATRLGGADCPESSLLREASINPRHEPPHLLRHTLAAWASGSTAVE